MRAAAASTLMIVLVAGCVSPPDPPALKMADRVVFQQGVSGYTGASDRQRIDGLTGAGTVLRAEAGYDISDIPPETTKTIAKVRGDRSRMEAMVPARPVTTAFSIVFRMPGMPQEARITKATLELSLHNLKEPSMLHYESPAAGDFSRVFRVTPGDESVSLDVTDLVRTALRRRGPLSVKVRPGAGGAWFYGVRHRRIERRPRLTVEFAAPVAVGRRHAPPEALKYVAKEVLSDPQKLDRFLKANTRIRAVKLLPAADAMVGSRGDPKGQYAGHAHVDTNFGSGLTLNVRDWYPGFDWRSFLKFDLGPLAGRRVHGAVLTLKTLNCPSSNAEKVKVYAVADEFDDWQEDAITWRNQPPVPCHYVFAGLDHQMVGPSKDKSTVGRWYHWEVSRYIEEELERGNRIASLCLKEEFTGSHSLPIFASREAGPGQSPCLIVLYEGAEVKPAPHAIARPDQPIARGARILLDFETPQGYEAAGMKKQPLKTAERGATSGRQALQATFEKGNAGIYITLAEAVDLTTHKWFCFDVTWHAESESGFGFAWLLEDPDSGGKWERNYHNEKLGLVPGRNTIRVPTKAIGYMNVDPKRAKRLHLYWTNAAGARPERAELSFDAFRLEGRE